MKITQYFKEKNVRIGLLLYALITTVIYFPTFQFYAGQILGSDLQFLIGLLFGVIYALKKSQIIKLI